MQEKIDKAKLVRAILLNELQTKSLQDVDRNRVVLLANKEAGRFAGGEKVSRQDVEDAVIQMERGVSSEDVTGVEVELAAQIEEPETQSHPAEVQPVAEVVVVQEDKASPTEQRHDSNGSATLPLFGDKANKTRIIEMVIEDELRLGRPIEDRNWLLVLARQRMLSYPEDQRVGVTRQDVDNAISRIRRKGGNAPSPDRSKARTQRYKGTVSKTEVIRSVVIEQEVDLSEEVDPATLLFLCQKKLEEYSKEDRPSLTKRDISRIVPLLRAQRVGMKAVGELSSPTASSATQKMPEEGYSLHELRTAAKFLDEIGGLDRALQVVNVVNDIRGGA